MTDQSKPFADIGQRLKRLREVNSAGSMSEWARNHGMNRSQWNNWEMGVRRPNVDDATMLCERYGASLDWIYRGDKSGLSVRMSQILCL